MGKGKRKARKLVEPDIVVTFKTTRGSFEVPPELFEDGAEHDLSVYLATHLPLGCTSLSRRYVGNVVVIHWRKIRVVSLDGQSEGPAVTSDNGARQPVRFR